MMSLKMNNYGYIYLTKDCLTNKIYIGQKKGSADHTQTYFGSGIIIRNIKKKRCHHLKRIVLGYCATQEELNEAEKLCIEFFDAQNPIYGYNIAEGGMGHIGKEPWNKGKHWSDEHRKKLSEAWKTRQPMSEETRKKVSIAVHSRIVTPETRAKLSASFTGKNHPRYGKPLSEEHKAKLSAAAKVAKRKPLTEEHKQKIKESWKKRKGLL